MPKRGEPGKPASQGLPAPHVRLVAQCNDHAAIQRALQTPSTKPDVRLAVTVAYGAMSPDQVARALRAPDESAVAAETTSPTVRLAHGPGAQGDGVLMVDGHSPCHDDSLPALLVSYYYLPQFEENRKRYNFRDWVMDSGAFSAHNSGVNIDIMEYIEKCKELMASDPQLTEIYALDVIGDWKASLKNTELMWEHGVPAIPCFHADEPWEALLQMAKDYPKIALGGVALAKGGKKMDWAGQCFARVWPKKIHGFAFSSEKAVLGLPFHSVDATSWEVGPCKFGQWRAFGGDRVSVRGSKQNLRVEVEWYLELERKARVKWKKQMEELETIAPTIRLAFAGTGSNTYLKEGGAVHRGLSAPPSVRLVAANDAGQGGARVIAKALGESDNAPGQKLVRAPRAKVQAPTIRLAEGGTGGRTDVKADAFK